jgi:hypothetical protein
MCVCWLQDTEWFESKRLKRGGRGGGRGGGRSGGRGGNSASTGSFHASGSRGGLGTGGSTGQLAAAAAAVGSFSGGTFSSGAYQALEDLDGGLEEEGVLARPALSPSAVAAAVPLNPVLEGLGELEPEEEEEKGEQIGLRGVGRDVLR